MTLALRVYQLGSGRWTWDALRPDFVVSYEGGYYDTEQAARSAGEAYLERVS